MLIDKEKRKGGEKGERERERESEREINGTFFFKVRKHKKTEVP